MLKDLLDLISNWYRKIFLSRTPATNSEPLFTAQSLRNSESKLDITIDSENSENECYKFQIKSRLDEMKNTFLSQLPKFNYEKEICVIYAENITDEFQIVKLVSNFANANIPVKPFFQDDTSTFTASIFSREDYDYIFMMNYAFQKAKCKSLRYIYGVDSLKITRGLNRTPNALIEPDDTEIAIQKIRNTNLFGNDYEINSFINDFYLPCISDQEAKFDLYCMFGYRENKQKYKKTYETIVNMLKSHGLFSIKWVNEYNLFVLLRQYFPSAIYQFRDTWLGRQSLDIFIPESKIAFEYQGEQHYRAIDYFGSEEMFRIREKNDIEKRKKCKTANVTLIEWPYTLDVNRENLEFIMQSNNISFDCTTAFSKEEKDLPLSILKTLEKELKNLPYEQNH